MEEDITSAPRSAYYWSARSFSLFLQMGHVSSLVLVNSKQVHRFFPLSHILRHHVFHGGAGIPVFLNFPNRRGKNPLISFDNFKKYLHRIKKLRPSGVESVFHGKQIQSMTAIDPRGPCFLPLSNSAVCFPFQLNGFFKILFTKILNLLIYPCFPFLQRRSFSKANPAPFGFPFLCYSS